MIRKVMIGGLTAMLLAGGAWAGERHDSSAGAISVERMAGGFDTPWSLGFLPDGGLLITERDGQLLHIDANWKRREVAGVPDVFASGQGGLFDIVPAKDFATTREVFLSYAEPVGNGARTALSKARLSESGDALESLEIIFRMEPVSTGSRHFGGRIIEAPDGTLFLTLGDRGQRPTAQEIGSHHGKIVRINRDGSIPDDNPDLGPGAAPGIWSVGHRNPQGGALDEASRLWTVSHGARGGDEVNLPQPGKNYGWPVISYGRHYSGLSIGEGTEKDGLEQPVTYWDPSIAPSGMIIYSGKLFPDWAGDIFVGSLKDDYISRLDREGDEIRSEEGLMRGEYGRIRDVREGPDGAIWFLSEGEGALYRITPAEAG